MTEPIDYRDQVYAALAKITPEQWMPILRGDEESLLPPCCGNVGHLREELTPLALGATFTLSPVDSLTSAAAAFEKEVGDHIETDSPLGRLATDLVAILDEHYPDWRPELRDYRKRLADDLMGAYPLVVGINRITKSFVFRDEFGVHVDADDLLGILRDPERAAAVVAARDEVQAEIDAEIAKQDGKS